MEEDEIIKFESLSWSPMSLVKIMKGDDSDEQWQSDDGGWWWQR